MWVYRNTFGVHVADFLNLERALQTGGIPSIEHESSASYARIKQANRQSTH